MSCLILTWNNNKKSCSTCLKCFFLFWEGLRDVKDFPIQHFKRPMDFCIFWQNPEWPRQLHTEGALMRGVKADFQITALSKTGRRFVPSICDWRGDCFQHWPSYHTTRRERDEPFPPALIPTLFPKPVGLGSQSFGLENYHFLMKKGPLRKLLASSTGI